MNPFSVCFETIAPEIRTRIYQILFGFRPVLVESDANIGVDEQAFEIECRDSFITQGRRSGQVLRVNHQIHDEASPVLQDQTTFKVRRYADPGAVPYISTSSKAYRVRHLEVEIALDDLYVMLAHHMRGEEFLQHLSILRTICTAGYWGEYGKPRYSFWDHDVDVSGYKDIHKEAFKEMIFIWLESRMKDFRDESDGHETICFLLSGRSVDTFQNNEVRNRNAGEC